MAPYRDGLEPLVQRAAALSKELREVEDEIARRRPFEVRRLPVTACSVDWSELDGEGRTRHCGRCGQRVFDVRGLVGAEVADLVGRSVRGCRGMRRRDDGTIVSEACIPETRPVSPKPPEPVVRLALTVAACAVVGMILWQNVHGPTRGGPRGADVHAAASEPSSDPRGPAEEAPEIDARWDAVRAQVASHRASLARHATTLREVGVQVDDHLADLVASTWSDGEPTTRDADVRRLTLACRALSDEVGRKAPTLADDFALRALGE